MQDEIEAKFIRQDHDVIRQKLKQLGGKLITPERLMKRVNYDFPDGRLAKDQLGWVRVRDEGDKITLSYKQSTDQHVDGMQEVSLVVDSFEKAEQFLQAIGITKRKAVQETKRESWLFDDAQVELDTWPWIPPFVEIEAPNQSILSLAAQKLGFNMQDALFGSVIPAYQAEYDITPEEIANWPEYKFGDVPDWLEKRRNSTL